MTERDKEVIEAANKISTYCDDHKPNNCIGCTFIFSQVCLLKWQKPDGWKASIEKVMERRSKHD